MQTFWAPPDKVIQKEINSRCKFTLWILFEESYGCFGSYIRNFHPFFPAERFCDVLSPSCMRHMFKMCSQIFMSGDCGSHFRSLSLWFSEYFTVDFEMCSGSLSCWRSQPVQIQRFEWLCHVYSQNLLIFGQIRSPSSHNFTHTSDMDFYDSVQLTIISIS